MLSARVEVVTDQVPSAATVPVPTIAPVASVTATVEPAGSVLVPVMVGVGVAKDSGGLAAVLGAVMVGASGAVTSTIITNATDVAVLPAASVDVAVMLCVPSAKVTEGRDHAPLASATAVPMDTPLSNTSTVDNGSAVPVIVWVVDGSGTSAAGPAIIGTIIAVSTMNVTEDGNPTFTEGSVIVTDSVCVPSVNDVVVMDQMPFSPTMPVPTTLPFPSVTVTVEPAGSVVDRESVGLGVSVDFGGRGVVKRKIMGGACGAVVCIVTRNAAEVAKLHDV